MARTRKPAPLANRGKLSRSNRMAKCRACGKLTHSDVQGAAGIELCGPCFEAAGLENEHSDGYHESEAHPDCPDCAASGASGDVPAAAQGYGADPGIIAAAAPPADPEARAAEFRAWLASERIGYGLLPTPEKMLRSPDSLTGAQRAWLQAFISRG